LAVKGLAAIAVYFDPRIVWLVFPMAVFADLLQNKQRSIAVTFGVQAAMLAAVWLCFGSE
jgi:hypothetical protein